MCSVQIEISNLLDKIAFADTLLIMIYYPDSAAP
jgi:hypothetical protein